MSTTKSVSPMERKRLGKWGRDTTPHFGWAVQEVNDLGDDVQRCQMCERAWIRFQYLVSHPQHGPLKVGCDCGGWMIGDTERSRRDIREMRNSAARRLREAQRKAEEERIAAAAQAERERIAAERARIAAQAAEERWRRAKAHPRAFDPEDFRRWLDAASSKGHP